MTEPPKHQAPDRNLLEVKLAVNHQKNRRREYLASLPANLSAFLADCPFVVTPEREVISPVFHVRPDGSSHAAHQASDYIHREFGWRQRVIQAALELKYKQFQEPAYFSPGSGYSSSRFGDPYYCVPFHWVIDNLSALYVSFLGVVTQDYSAGLVIDDYVGYMQDDLNPDEIVYELASWGCAAP